MSTPTSQLVERIGGHPVLIWGARMTGIGLARFCRKHGIGLIGFIDSDPAFAGKSVSGLPCFPPSQLVRLLNEYPDLKIVVAASTKEAEINQILIGAGLSPERYINYSAYCSIFYTIDVVGTCNLKCQSCAHGAGGQKYTRGIMSLGDFKAVVDKIVAENELVTHISLYSWGEPFLHPDLPEMVDYLHSRGIAAALSSNLSIKNENLFRKVIQRGPEYLKVSVSGFYPETYNQTHQGGDIYLVRSNLLRLKHYIDKYKLDVFVDVNYHLYNNNNGVNLQKMAELCQELGFSLSKTYALVMPLERVIDKLEGRATPVTLDLEKKLLVTIEEGIAASKEGAAAMTECPFLANQTIINWDLSVPVCCTTFNRAGTMVSRNFLETPAEEINLGKKSMPICATCFAHGLPAYNLGLNRANWERIAATKTSSDH